MTASRVEDGIIAEARRLGFATAGFATAGEASGTDVFNAWLALGAAGSMEYLHRHAPLRQHPSSVSPSVVSIVAAIARYPVNPAPRDGGFCMTARTRDYHDVVRGKLRVLGDFIKTHSPARILRIAVDSAPLPEREWAVRAGIGWQGRQGQIISPLAGACGVLGFLLVDTPFAPSEPIANQCGDCHRCVDHCPSQAILENRRVDARRCASYLSIEHRGDFNEAQQKNIGNALFGCDICTAACPWNERATAPVMQELKAICAPPTPADLLAMTQETFNIRFDGTAVKRSGLERLQRNAAGRSGT